jgi:hypothetical protein
MNHFATVEPPMEEKAQLTLVDKRDLDPATRLKLKWEQVQKHSTSTELEKDKSQAEAMAEAEADGMTQQDIAACVGISQGHVDKLLRYHRFLIFQAGLNSTEFKITEGRFRTYWKNTVDPQSMRGRRTKDYREQYERRVFLAIIEKLEAGHPPPTPVKVKKPPTVAQMHARKKPLTALRKEVKRLYSTECQPILAQLKDFLGRDRSTFAPSLMAACAMDLDKWAKKLDTLLADFDTYVQD